MSEIAGRVGMEATHCVRAWRGLGGGGVARWMQNRCAAKRGGRANGAGRQGGGVSEAKALAGAGRGVGERSEAGRGDRARSAMLARDEPEIAQSAERAWRDG